MLQVLPRPSPAAPMEGSSVMHTDDLTKDSDSSVATWTTQQKMLIAQVSAQIPSRHVSNDGKLMFVFDVISKRFSRGC